MTSLVISFACFTEILNQISPELMQIFTNGKTVFLFFQGGLCDTPKESRGKNLIIVSLKVSLRNQI